MHTAAQKLASLSFNAAVAARPRRKVAVVLNQNALKVDGKVVQTLASVTPAEDLYLSRSLDEGKQIAHKVVSRGYDAVLFGGGDGTLVRGVEHLSRAAKDLMVEVPAIGVLRLGTGNAFADFAGASEFTPSGLRADVLRARAGAAVETRPVRMLETMGRVTPFCGFGLDAQILQDHHMLCDLIDKSPLAKALQSSNARYALSVALVSIPRFVASKRSRVRIVNLGSPALKIGVDGAPTGAPVKAGDVIWEGPCSIAACASIPFYGLGMKMFPFAEMRKDRFQLRAGEAGTVEVLSNLPALFRGEYRSPRIHDVLCDHVALEMNSEQSFQVGGDLAGRHQRVEVKLGDSFRLA